MYAVTVAFNNLSWRFLFRSKDAAEKFRQFSDYPTQDLIIDDDFGQHAEIRAGAIAGIQIEDMEQSRLVHVEQMLWQHRIQRTAQDRVKREPGLATAIPMLDPMAMQRPQ